MLTNGIFSGNSAANGGGMRTYYSNATLTNCTFSGNRAGYGGGIYNYESNPTLTSCILWGDTPQEIYVSSGTPVVTYSDVRGGWSGDGDNNTDVDPCFALPGFWADNGTPTDANDDFWVNGDYHLKSQAGRWDPNSQTWVLDSVTSPCIDAGNPGCPPGHEPDPNGNRINMGAYAGTTQASKSPPNWALLADLTNDHIVDYRDLQTLACYWLQAGECIPADLSRDQSVDGVDYALLALQWLNTTSSEPGMNYQVGECDFQATDADAGEPNFTVWVEGRYIHFEDMMTANCCPDELGLEMTVEGNLITIRETELTTSPCRCICDYPVTAMMGPFEPGIYSVEALDQYGQLLGVVQVVVDGSAPPPMACQVADCNMKAAAL
jgi:hypothetical protein